MSAEIKKEIKLVRGDVTKFKASVDSHGVPLEGR